MNPGELSVRNRALVNAVFILIVAVGAYSLITIPRELNPKVGFNWAFITVAYTGATPEEMEELVAIPIEDEIYSVEDIDEILSRSRAGLAFVWVKFEQIPEREFERRVDDVRARISTLDLPDGCDDPDVQEFSSYDFQPVVSVVLHGDVAESTLHDLARNLEREVRSIAGVGKVDLLGDRDRAILVECDPHRLASHRIDIVDVELALRLSNLNLPAGVLKLGRQELLLRTKAEFESASEIADVVLRAGSDGRRIRIGDVATVSDGFKERTQGTRFDGAPSIALAVTKNESGNTLDIVSDLRALLDRSRAHLPPGVELSLANDESLVVAYILGILQSNALLGMVLVVLALLLFLGWRCALCAALGIPVTFLLAVVTLDWTGQSLNGSTLFGLILVLGMVVDDAIVILENSYRHLQMGKQLGEAVIDGVREVVAPVAVSSFTTMAGFLPLVLMSGTIGKFMRIIPITVSLVLLASLFESLWILPSHFVDIVRLKQRHDRGESRMARWQRGYKKVLKLCLMLRYPVVLLAVLTLVVSVYLIEKIGVDLFSAEKMSTLQVMITMPDGTSLEETERVIEQFEERALALPGAEVQGVLSDVGLLQRDDEWTFASHVGQVLVDVVEVRDRERSMDEILAELRATTKDIPGPVQLELLIPEQGPPEGAAIGLLFKGSDLDQLAAVAELIKGQLERAAGVHDIRDDLNLRQPELDVIVDREAAVRHGLDATRIARSVRAAFAGTTATTFRRSDEEITVIVRLPEAHRRQLADISGLDFVTPTGAVVPFSTVARLTERTGPQVIRRHERERSVTVMAEVDPEITDLAQVNREITAYFERIRSAFPGVRMEPAGQFKEFWEAFEDLTKLFALGLLINFMLMAGQFKSWSQPLIIMAVVPLSFIGAMLGLLVSGAPFSITTLYSFVALAGVAINDSIVLIDFINKSRQQGSDRWESIHEAGRLRLRPIMLTSITTIFGLLPMAIGLGGKSETWQPMATTIAAGLALATVICLLVIPCLQAIVDDFAHLLRRRPDRP